MLQKPLGKYKKNEINIMIETLKIMQSSDSQLTRKQVQHRIEQSNAIFDQNIDKTKISKNGNKYNPFRIRCNISIKHLIIAGYIYTYNKNHYLKLSEKGIHTDLTKFDPIKDVYPLTDNYWNNHKKHQNNQKNLIINKSNKNNSDYNSNNETKTNKIENWRSQLLDALKQMPSQKFESFSRGLIQKMGIELDKSIGTSYVADGGIDGFGYITVNGFLRTTRVAIQVKRWNNKISSTEIDNFQGAMDKYNAEYGIFITNNDFTRNARKTAVAGTRVITLINGDKICDLVAKYKYHVEPVTTYKLDSFYTNNN